MVEAAAEVWFKVELVHWIIENRKAKDNLLRRMSSMPSENRSPPTEFNTELKVEEARYTLRKLVTTLG